MKAAVIGASAEALHTIEKAHEQGLFVAALDGNPEADGLKAADRALVVDISDEEAVIAALHREQPDFVLTVPVGRYLTSVGAANDALGLPGISKKMAALCTDKYAFHVKLAENNLRACRCYVLGKDKETEKELPIDFPAILKPRYGSGSRGIHLVASRKELESALAEVAGEEYVLEECIAGEEFGVDGCITERGFQLILLRRKENTPPPARQAVGYYSVQPDTPFWQETKNYVEKVTACLGLKDCLFHADLIKGESGPFVIELSARPSGHNLHNLFTPLCTGVDMAEEYIRYRMGQTYCFEPKGTKSMLIHYFDMSGQIEHVPDRREAQQAAGVSLVEWECNIAEGDVLCPVSDGHSLMGRGFFILEDPDPDKLKKGAEAVKKRFF